MEYTSVETLHDKNEGSIKNEIGASVQSEMDVYRDLKEHASSPVDLTQFNKVDRSDGGKVASGACSVVDVEVSGELNMEASITTDDVMRAGGFGARDDIGCFLPVASDSTDFEASLRDARGYEDPQEEISRPGLGWTEVGKEE